MIYYTSTHEWISADGDIAVLGVTEHAASALGTLVYVELPEIGQRLQCGDSCAVVESAKSASDVYTPISGEVIEVNSELVSNPDLINDSASDCWIVKIKMSNSLELDDLLDESEYNQTLDHH